METTNILLYGDFGKQYDDELALLTALGYEKQGLLKVEGVIGNYTAAEQRARLAHSMLYALGRPDIPVGVGIDPDPDLFDAYEFRSDYTLTTSPLPSAKDLVCDVLANAKDRAIRPILNSSMEDPAQLLANEPLLFAKKVGKVILQAGVLIDANGPILSKRGFLQPDDSFNNVVAPEAAAFLFEELQGRGIPATFVTRYAVRKRIRTERGHIIHFRDDSLVAETIYHRMCNSMEKLWQTANSLEKFRDSPHPLLNREYFLQEIVGGSICESIIGKYIPEEYVPAKVTDYNTYDPLAVLASVPSLAKRYLRPAVHEVNGVPFKIVGVDKDTPNIICPQKACHNMEVARIDALRTPENKETADFAEKYSIGMHVYYRHQDKICPDSCDHSTPFDKKPRPKDTAGDTLRAKLKEMGPKETERQLLAGTLKI